MSGGRTHSDKEYAELKEQLVDLESRFAKQENDLADCHLRMSTFFDNNLDAIIMVNSETGQIEDVNAGAVRCLGYTREFLLGEHFSIIFPPKLRDKRKDVIERISIHGYVFEEQAFLLSNGATMFADLSAVMVQTATTGVIMMTLRDVAERKRDQDARLRLESLKARLDAISKLNQDINNPLQELLSRVEVAGENDIYREPVMRITAVLRRLREEEKAALADLEQAESRTLEPIKPEAAEEPTVLIVDDEAQIRLLFNAILTRKFPGLSIDVAVSGEEAVEKFEQKHHTIIIMDVQMPGILGDEAFRRIMKLADENGWRKPAVVFCTGYALSEELQVCVNSSPACGCLLKPASALDLIDAVRERIPALA